MEKWIAYLKATTDIDSNHPQIIAQAKELARGCITDREKAIRIFYFVREEIAYHMYPQVRSRLGYRASHILQTKKGWCLQKSILTVALARALQIPARLWVVTLINHTVSQDTMDALGGTNQFFPHVFVDFYLNGDWIKATPIFEKSICERVGVPTVEFNGIQDAMLSKTDLTGRPYAEYVSSCGAYADVPWALIFEGNKKTYGEKYQIWFEESFLEDVPK